MDWRDEEALWRYRLIREPAGRTALMAERGALVRGWRSVARAPVG